MKIIVLVVATFFLFACSTTSPGSQQYIEESEARADAARQRAQAHGQLPGTPDNMSGIERADKEAANYQARADERKHNSTLWLIILEVIFGD